MIKMEGAMAGAGGDDKKKQQKKQQQPCKKPAAEKPAATEKSQVSKASQDAPCEGKLMIDNLVSNISAMVDDPPMQALFHGMDDSILTSGQTTVIHSATQPDVDYIVIPL